MTAPEVSARSLDPQPGRTMGLSVLRNSVPAPIRIEDILERMEGTPSEQGWELVRQAYVFSARVHRGQERLSGEPYLSHPLAVAMILADLGLDAVSIAVGLLHDVLEDTRAGRQQVESIFGEEVAGLVEGVTKISQISFTSKEQEQAENFRKLLLAMVKDIRVLMVKLADRLHNMRTLEYLPAEARLRNARETLDIYAPLAQRLGMGRMQAELQDLALHHTEPEAYAALMKAVEDQPRVRRAFISRVRLSIEQALEEQQIPARVEDRVKSLASLYRKLSERDSSLDQIYDVVAFRIITDTVKNCYAALGIVHGRWRPVPGRFKDFIAMPKPNMYQSLHTTVIDAGQPFELQIRTEQMHKVAEEGIAAHWLYKEGRAGAAVDAQQFKWLRQIVEWQREIPDARDFLASLKLDLYPGEVYVFTPRGEVKVFPSGATPIDFAYAVHTEVGHHCIGAKVNGSLVPLRTQLRNGDIVEIRTNPEAQPSRDWLRLVKTSRARGKIRSIINKRERERSIELGERICEKELRKYGLHLKKVLVEGALDELAPQFGVGGGKDLLAAVGYGKVSARQLAERLLPPETIGAQGPEERRGRLGDAVRRVLGWGAEPAVRIEGMDDILVFRARCCDPIPGEPIVGYVTRGKGVSVHAASCRNVEQLLLNPERRVPVVWGNPKDGFQPVRLAIQVDDRQGLLAEITSKISDKRTNIRHIESRMDGSSRGLINLVIDVTDVKHLQVITELLLRIKGVRGVKRLR
ncbi:MAG: RelA/SpoT family protein [Acidobacteriota bacterium]